MPGSTSNRISARLLTSHSAFTCIYTSILLLFLVYFKCVYSLGKRISLPLIAVIVCAECFKLTLSSFPSRTAPQPREKGNKIKKPNFRNKLKCLLIILTMIVIYYIIAVLFGAPFTSEQEGTLMFSLLLASLTVVPSCLNLGFDTTFALLSGLTTYQNDVHIATIKNSICITLMGAWLGAIVIPLDWDRPWQVWPIPCSVGAIMGYMFSHVFVLIKSVPRFNKLFVKRTGKYGL